MKRENNFLAIYNPQVKKIQCLSLFCIKDVEIRLSPIGFKILGLLVNGKGKVLTHSYIQKEVWGRDSGDGYQSLRVFIANLRKKIEIHDHKYIHTEIGIGYRFY